MPILVRVTFAGGPDLVGAAFTAGTAGSLAGMVAAAGFAWSVCIIAATATLQTADPAMTGRVMAIFAAVLLGGTAAGGPAAALLADLADPRAPFIVGSLAGVAGACLARAGGRLRRPV